MPKLKWVRGERGWGRWCVAMQRRNGLCCHTQTHSHLHTVRIDKTISRKKYVRNPFPLSLSFSLSFWSRFLISFVCRLPFSPSIYPILCLAHRPKRSSLSSNAFHPLSLSLHCCGWVGGGWVIVCASLSRAYCTCGGKSTLINFSLELSETFHHQQHLCSRCHHHHHHLFP